MEPVRIQFKIMVGIPEVNPLCGRELDATSDSRKTGSVNSCNPIQILRCSGGLNLRRADIKTGTARYGFRYTA